MSKKTLSGIVTSTSMNKTITVQVVREVRHPKYNKLYKVSKKFHAHDEKEETNKGDEVTIEEISPISKTKTWTLKSVDKKVTKLQQQLQGVEI
ncbi:MAG: 30S ribosomal protein S17 [Candidatus Nomurabacteria bacterium]|nr:MAG: 30S ribosomal protein S17 [Candidatus Nomurabacteria bacterium]HRV76178.1 30S ribosomal protein S17 [Candidatus Saccharimonadales bacterium]